MAMEAFSNYLFATASTLSRLAVTASIIITTCCLVLWFAKRGLLGKTMTISRSPPGSRGLPLIGETLAFVAANNSKRGLYSFVADRYVRYGSCCFKTSIFGKTHVFVSSAGAAKSLMGSSAESSGDFAKRYIRSIGELLGEQSLLCSSHEEHKFIKRHISKLFALAPMDSFVAMFDELTVEAMNEWAQKKHVVVLDEALKLTLHAISRMLMNVEERDELQDLTRDISAITEALLSFPVRFPGTRFYKGLRARVRIMNKLKEKLARRRKGSEDRSNDFLSYLVAKDDQSAAEDSLTDEQILDNILTLIIAGQVTTATAIMWMVKYLDDNKQVQENLREMHLDSAFTDSSAGSQQGLDADALDRMQYALKVVKETLRMATIVSWFPREALKDCQVEGFHIQRGWIVNVDAKSIHSDARIYKDPSKFDPGRFDVQELGADPKPYSFLAFGAGGRTCLGANLAKTMMLVFLHRLVTTFRWKRTDLDGSLAKWAMFPRLKNGCPVSLAPLASPQTSGRAAAAQ